MAERSLLRTDKELTDLYERHIDTVYRLCYTLLHSAPEAEDAAQTVFVKLMECNIAFENSAHERAWLITTAKNYCLDLLRHWWKRKRVELDSLPETGAPDLTEEDGELLEQLLSLPAKYKLVLYLFYYEGYSSAEIAQLLNLNDNTVRTRLRTGRRKLKISLEGEQYDPKRA